MESDFPNPQAGRGQREDNGEVLPGSGPSCLALWHRLLDNHQEKLGSSQELPQLGAMVHDWGAHQEGGSWDLVVSKPQPPGATM